MTARTAALATAPPTYDVMRVREDFPILKTRMNGRPLVYLDTAASAQKPGVVTAVSGGTSSRTSIVTSAVAAASQSTSAGRFGPEGTVAVVSRVRYCNAAKATKSQDQSLTCSPAAPC